MIYVFLWFWFAVLTILTVLNFVWSVGIVFARTARGRILRRKLWINPNRAKYRLKIDPTLITSFLDFGDWKLFYHILKNLDSITFAEFCQKLTERLQAEEEKRLGKSDTLPLKEFLLAADKAKENLNKTSPVSDKKLKPLEDDDPARLGFDGDYLKPKIESDI